MNIEITVFVDDEQIISQLLYVMPPPEEDMRAELRDFNRGTREVVQEVANCASWMYLNRQLGHVEPSEFTLRLEHLPNVRYTFDRASRIVKIPTGASTLTAWITET